MADFDGVPLGSCLTIVVPINHFLLEYVKNPPSVSSLLLMFLFSHITKY